MHKDGLTKFLVFNALIISAAAAAAYRLRRRKTYPKSHLVKTDVKSVPKLVVGNWGGIEELESFSDYVARQMGFESGKECPQLGKLAIDYLKKTNGCEDSIYGFISKEPEPEIMYVKLVQELDRCILGYFAFHWTYATQTVTQILSANDGKPKRRFKDMVMKATRKQRFERITQRLKVARVFSTLVEEMKAIGLGSQQNSHTNGITVPAALCDRSPVLLLMGGGMGAGKSTILKDILKDAFWSEALSKAVVVEADAFKETDIIYRALKAMGRFDDMLQTAELVHQSSTNAASSLLVTALNKGRDIIMDGTLSWEPFVEQTIAMARNVHLHRYRMGAGYRKNENGSITENYWEQVQDTEDYKESDAIRCRKPYRIELVGVVCDAYLAVVRGIRRAIIMGRAVRVKSQLKSHKKFASAFPRYCHLVDNVRLYCSTSSGPPKLIAWKEGDNNLLIDPEEFCCLKTVSDLNEDAHSVLDLYNSSEIKCGSYSYWKSAVICPTRSAVQEDLKVAIKSIEGLQVHS